MQYQGGSGEDGAERWSFAVGGEVLDAAGEKLGYVVEVRPTDFVVEKGAFFPDDHCIPYDVVETFDLYTLQLRLTKEEALGRIWDQAPPPSGPASTAENT